MQFLKILFWCLLAFVAAVFTIGNWTIVTIKLWGGLEALVNLPLLLLVTFLAGMLPTMLYYHGVRWRLRSRLAMSERTISDLRLAIAPPLPLPPPVVKPPAPPPSSLFPTSSSLPTP